MNPLVDALAPLGEATVSNHMFAAAHAKATGIITAHLRATGNMTQEVEAQLISLMNWHVDVMWSAIHSADLAEKVAEETR